MRTIRRMWQLLPGRHWPMLPDQEAAFVEDLERLAGTKQVTTTRDDLTILLSALRCGTDADVLFEHAPGTDAAALLACYRWVDGLRRRSMRAWEQIELSPNVATVHNQSPEAVKLLPIPVRRVVATIESIDLGHSAMARLSESIAESSAQVHRVRVRAHGMEHELHQLWHHNPEGLSPDKNYEMANQIGQRLYDPLAPGIYGDAYFLADRVSTLSPLRIRDLLGERHIHTQLTI